MKSQTVTLSFLFMSLLFVSCEDDEPNIITSQESPLFTYYPTEVGNYWNYERLFRFVGPDTNSNLPDSVYSVAHVEIEGEKLLNDTLNTYEFVEYHTDNNTNVVYTHFTNDANGFYMQAYRSAGIATPVKSAYKIVLMI